jgi:hypothetical protein
MSQPVMERTRTQPPPQRRMPLWRQRNFTLLWAGQTISGADTLVMYTYGGDANLDGKLNIDDYVRIDQGIAAGLKGWANGDFNYDGLVNSLDFDSLSMNFNKSLPAPLITLVPEPRAILFGVAFIFIARRRRCQLI